MNRQKTTPKMSKTPSDFDLLLNQSDQSSFITLHHQIPLTVVSSNFPDGLISDYPVANSNMVQEKIRVWAVILQNNQICLAKRSNKVNNPRCLNFFGGTVLPEEKLLSALHRELKEESGLSTKRNPPIHLTQFTFQNKIHHFYLINYTKPPKISLDFESSSYKWYQFKTPSDLKKILKLKLHPPTREFLTNHNNLIFNLNID